MVWFSRIRNVRIATSHGGTTVRLCCTCYKKKGPVEGYLSQLESHIRLMLRDILESARSTADGWETGENPRDYWLEADCLITKVDVPG